MCLGLRKLPEYLDSIEWSKWQVFWLDERVVPKTHEDSNYKLALDGFLCKVYLLVLCVLENGLFSLNMRCLFMPNMFSNCGDCDDKIGEPLSYPVWKSI